MPHVDIPTKSQSHDTPQELMRRNVLKMPPSPFVTPMLTLRRKTSLFLHAISTAYHYFGAPTRFHSSDTYDVLKYVQLLFANYDGVDKKALFHKAKSLKPKKRSILVELKKIALCDRQVLLFDDDILFCRIGTETRLSQSTRKLKASHVVEFDEKFTIIITSSDNSIVVETWLKRPRKPPAFIGKSVKNILFCPHDQSMSLFCFQEKRSSCDILVGTVELKCIFQMEPSKDKHNVLYRHVLFCYKIFEHQLMQYGHSFSDISDNAGDAPDHRRLKDLLPEEALTFLHQHSIQSSLSPLDNITCCFLVANQWFSKTSDISLLVPLTFLEEMLHLRQGTKEIVDPTLEASVTSELQSSARKCAQRLMKLLTVMIENESLAFEMLDCTKKFLDHVKFYIPNVNDRVIEFMRKSPVKLHFGKQKNVGEPFMTESFENILKWLRNMVEALKKCDSAFSRIFSSETSYTSLVYRSLDAQVSDTLYCMMQRLEKSEKSLIIGVDSVVRSYTLAIELIMYMMEQVPTLTDGQLQLAQACTKWVPYTTFFTFMKAQSDKHNLAITSWCKCKKNLEGNDSFTDYTNDMLHEWKALLWLNPLPPTKAMLQVFSAKCIESFKRLEETLKNSGFAANNVAAKREHANSIYRKVMTILQCVEAVRFDLKDLGLSDVSDVKTEIEKISLNSLMRLWDPYTFQKFYGI